MPSHGNTYSCNPHKWYVHELIMWILVCWIINHSLFLSHNDCSYSACLVPFSTAKEYLLYWIFGAVEMYSDDYRTFCSFCIKQCVMSSSRESQPLFDVFCYIWSKHTKQIWHTQWTLWLVNQRTECQYLSRTSQKFTSHCCILYVWTGVLLCWNRALLFGV